MQKSTDCLRGSQLHLLPLPSSCWSKSFTHRWTPCKAMCKAMADAWDRLTSSSSECLDTHFKPPSCKMFCGCGAFLSMPAKTQGPLQSSSRLAVPINTKGGPRSIEQTALILWQSSSPSGTSYLKFLSYTSIQYKLIFSISISALFLTGRRKL